MTNMKERITTEAIYLANVDGPRTLRAGAEDFAMHNWSEPRKVSDFAVHGEYATFSVTYISTWNNGRVAILRVTPSEQARANALQVNLEQAMLHRLLNTGSIYLSASAQARADAMADAETLELALRGVQYPDMNTPVFAAKAAFLSATVVACIRAGLHQHAGLQAADAASAAFRAVPDLRGPDTSNKRRA